MPPSPVDLDLGLSCEVLVEDVDGGAHYELKREQDEGEEDKGHTGVGEGEV